MVFCFSCCLPTCSFRPPRVGHRTKTRTSACFPFSFMHNGEVRHEPVFIADCVWDPECDPWNGKFTRTGGNRVPNCNIPMDFPVGLEDENTGGIIVVTTAMVNAYRDDYMTNRFRTFYDPPDTIFVRRISNPTWSYNCHGHSIRIDQLDPFPFASLRQISEKEAYAGVYETVSLVPEGLRFWPITVFRPKP